MANSSQEHKDTPFPINGNNLYTMPSLSEDCFVDVLWEIATCLPVYPFTCRRHGLWRAGRRQLIKLKEFKIIIGNFL